MSTTEKVLGSNMNRLGLSELLKFSGQSSEEPAPMHATYVQMIPVDQIVPNPYQPREFFAPEALETLASSIQSQGVLQPLLVRQIGDAQYQLVAGERRLQASRRAGLDKVPVIMRAFDDKTTMLVALIENMQREDLNVIEQAKAYAKILDQTGWTHAQLAEYLGKSRPALSNELRLLQLPESIQSQVLQGCLSEGQARCLLGLPSDIQSELVEKIKEGQWSVRQIEHWVRQFRQNQSGQTQGSQAPSDDSLKMIRAFEAQLAAQLSTKVKIQSQASGQGWVRIHYDDFAKLEQLLAHIKS